MRTGCDSGLNRLLLVLVLVSASPSQGQDTTAPPALAAPGDAALRAHCFFQSPQLCTFQVELGPAEYRELSQNSRGYVLGRVRVDGQVYEQVGVRLKGSGTFEPVGRHPNLALKFNWKNPKQEFAGLTKLFLNNARQDPSYLSEYIASGAYADAGVPSPRITHARVELNGRDLGLSVVTEAVNRGFLKRHFGNGSGNLYEGVFQDISARLEKDNGKPDDYLDLHRLAVACAQRDLAKRRAALSVLLDTEQALNFMAVEMIIANWDGYTLYQNNYRIYHNPITDRFTIVPHGIDNAFFESGLSFMPPRKSVLAAAYLTTTEDRAAFRERVSRLVPVVLDLERIDARLRAELNKIKQGASPAEADALDRRTALFQQRVHERWRHLQDELDGRHPPTPVFSARGIAQLSGWIPKPDWNGSPIALEPPSDKGSFSIRATNHFCFGSWRLPVWLTAGKYRIEAVTKTRDVAGLPSRTGSGAGVRALGTMRGGGVQGTADWTPVQHEFTVQEGCEWVELIAELRAYEGAAQFDPGQFRLVRLSTR